MSNVNQSLHNTSNLQKQLLEMSAAAAASMNAAKEADSKSRKGKNQSRQPTYPNSKQSHQYQSSSRAKDAYDSRAYSQSKQNESLQAGYPGNSNLLGVRLPPDTEIIKYTSGSKKSCK